MRPNKELDLTVARPQVNSSVLRTQGGARSDDTGVRLSEDAVRLSATGAQAALRIRGARRRLIIAAACSSGGILPGLIRTAVGAAEPWEHWTVIGVIVFVVSATSWAWAALPRRLAVAVDDSHIHRTVAQARPCVKCGAVLIPIDVGRCWRCGATQPLGWVGVAVLAVLIAILLAVALRSCL